MIGWTSGPDDARGTALVMIPAGAGAGAEQGSSLLLQLLHPVQSAARTEPLDLRLVEGVVQEDGFLGPIGVLDDAFQGLQWGRQVWVESHRRS